MTHECRLLCASEVGLMILVDLDGLSEVHLVGLLCNGHCIGEAKLIKQVIKKLNIS